MARREQVLQAIERTIDDVNSERSSGARIVFNEALVLLGVNSPLDSLDFVNFVAGLEEHLRSDLGLDVDLTRLVMDETAGHPFRSVAALADYVSTHSA